MAFADSRQVGFQPVGDELGIPGDELQGLDIEFFQNLHFLMFYGNSVAVCGNPDQQSGQWLSYSDSTTFPGRPAESDHFLENIDRGDQVVIFPR